MGLMRLKMSARDSLYSKRLMETIETHGNYWGLINLIETAAYS